MLNSKPLTSVETWSTQSFFYFRIRISALQKNRFFCLTSEFFWVWITWYAPHSSLPSVECNVGAKKLHFSALWIALAFYSPKEYSDPSPTFVAFSVFWEEGNKEKFQYLIPNLQIFQNIHQNFIFISTCNLNYICFNAGKVYFPNSFLFLVSAFFEMLTEQQMANLAVPFCISGI